jgi:hypothetical protein
MSKDNARAVASLGGPAGKDGEGTPQDGTVRLPQVDADGRDVQDYVESSESLHPLNELD